MTKLTYENTYRDNKAKVYKDIKDCETTNIIERRLIKNSKGLKVPDCNTEQSKQDRQCRVSNMPT
jgi:hypothetical protein